MIGAASKLTWYATRSSGMVAWAVVTASILWGLALSTRIIRRKGAPAWILDLHKFLGTLSLIFVGIHISRCGPTTSSTSDPVSCSSRWHRTGDRERLHGASSQRISSSRFR
jgi:hypothetical protein